MQLKNSLKIRANICWIKKAWIHSFIGLFFHNFDGIPAIHIWPKNACHLNCNKIIVLRFRFKSQILYFSFWTWSRSYQTLFFFVFRFLLLSLSVCYKWKKCINYKNDLAYQWKNSRIDFWLSVSRQTNSRQFFLN